MDIKKIETDAETVFAALSGFAPALAVLAGFLPSKEKKAIQNTVNIIQTLSISSPTLAADVEKVLADVVTIVAAIKASLVQGRAASWIATMVVSDESAAKPLQTESWRSAPPTTRRKGF